MAKRTIQKIDLVPEWVREALQEEPAKQIPVGHSFRVPNLGMSVPAERKISAELYKDPGGSAVVQLSWAGTNPPVYEFQKKYGNWKDAELVFSSLLKELREVESYVDAAPDRAKEKVKALFDEYRAKGDQAHVSPSEVGSRSQTQLEIADGWTIISKQGQLLVSFSNEFLNNVFSSFKKVNDFPNQSTEQVYSTATRQHCGLDNFVASHWRKLNTTDGNILRNAVLINRQGGESYFFSGVSINDYNLICSSLTPEPKMYGISYDSITNQWYKTAAVVERYFSQTPEELDKILEFLGKGKKSKEPMGDLLTPKEEKPSKKEETLPLEGLEETAPLSEATSTTGNAEEELMDLLKKESNEK